MLDPSRPIIVATVFARLPQTAVPGIERKRDDPGSLRCIGVWRVGLASCDPGEDAIPARLMRVPRIAPSGTAEL
jgi:hypothetical protein